MFEPFNFVSDSLDQSIYDPYDPFDYFYSPPSRGSQNSDPIYSAVIKVSQQPTGPPVPPRNKLTFSDSQVIKIFLILLYIFN